MPISKSQREAVEALRDWLREGRAQSASYAEKVRGEQDVVQIQVGSSKEDSNPDVPAGAYGARPPRPDGK